MEKLIYYFLKHNKFYSLEYHIPNDCIRICELWDQNGIIYIFKGMENLMRPVCTINLREEYINTSHYLFIRKILNI